MHALNSLPAAALPPPLLLSLGFEPQPATSSAVTPTTAAILVA